MEKSTYRRLRKKAVMLRPHNGIGSVQVLWTGFCLALALFLSTSSNGLIWLFGQLFLAVPLFQCFVLLHEAGHGTLFRSKTLNFFAGLVSSFFCLIPYASWKKIHQKHHIHTGWQDLDPTTVSLVPRKLSAFEMVLVNFSWKTWFPLFSILYRLSNYWNLPRLWKMFPLRPDRLEIAFSIGVILAGVFAAGWSFGFLTLFKIFGLGFFFHLVLSDPILLSQHTHIPQKLAMGRRVLPVPVSEQDRYTRSLAFPPWISKWIFYHFDAHEAHHAFPTVPGFRLDALRFQGDNGIGWLEYLLKSKKMSAHVFLFKNRDETGVRF